MSEIRPPIDLKFRGLAADVVIACLVVGCRSVHPAADATADGPPCSVTTSAAMNIPICCGKAGQTMYYNCWPWSLVEGNLQSCVKEGDSFDGHLISFGVACCPGSATLAVRVVTDAAMDKDNGLPEGCDFPPGPPGLVLCRRCGDGVCSSGENRCNCPEDCPPR
jgi:hypothetical protein